MAATRAQARARGAGPLGGLTSLIYRWSGRHAKVADPVAFLARWRDRGSLGPAVELIRGAVAEALHEAPAGTRQLARARPAGLGDEPRPRGRPGGRRRGVDVPWSAVWSRHRPAADRRHAGPRLHRGLGRRLGPREVPGRLGRPARGLGQCRCRSSRSLPPCWRATSSPGCWASMRAGPVADGRGDWRATFARTWSGRSGPGLRGAGSGGCGAPGAVERGSGSRRGLRAADVADERAARASAPRGPPLPVVWCAALTWSMATSARSVSCVGRVVAFERRQPDADADLASASMAMPMASKRRPASSRSVPPMPTTNSSPP